MHGLFGFVFCSVTFKLLSFKLFKNNFHKEILIIVFFKNRCLVKTKFKKTSKVISIPPMNSV